MENTTQNDSMNDLPSPFPLRVTSDEGQQASTSEDSAEESGVEGEAPEYRGNSSIQEVSTSVGSDVQQAQGSAYRGGHHGHKRVKKDSMSEKYDEFALRNAEVIC